MKDQLEQYLMELVETLKQGGQFAIDQLPLFVEEYLAWGFWESVGLAFVFLVVILLSHKYVKIQWDKACNYESKNAWDDGEVPLYTSAVLLFVGNVGAGILMVMEIFEAIKITVAPRVYLIENLMHLIK